MLRAGENSTNGGWIARSFVGYDTLWHFACPGDRPFEEGLRRSSVAPCAEACVHYFALLLDRSITGERTFHRYHRVLSRAVWSSREASCVLLRLLVEAFVLDGPLVVGIDETLERRRGKKIRAKGIYRDPVRSNRSHFVKASALRWVCVMLLALVRGLLGFGPCPSSVL